MWLRSWYWKSHACRAIDSVSKCGSPTVMNILTWRSPSGRVSIVPRGPKPAKRFPILTLVACLLLLVGVVGCGDERTGSAESRQQDPESASGTPSPRASPDSANNGAKPDPRALGIDMVQWPGDLVGDWYGYTATLTWADFEPVAFTATGVLEKVRLPDGSIFMGAGRIDLLASTVDFPASPDHGVAKNQDAFCAALSA